MHFGSLPSLLVARVRPTEVLSRPPFEHSAYLSVAERAPSRDIESVADRSARALLQAKMVRFQQPDLRGACVCSALPT